jgi:cyclic pyranopterin phosphate synthase
MVDVGEKPVTRREAVARGRVRLSPEALRLLVAGALPKGDCITAAELAGVQAAKRTWEVVPLCHPIAIDTAKVDVKPVEGEGAVEIVSRVSAHARTGVEMEALAAVAAAALTIYDMTKGVDRGGVIDEICLLEKRGGKSGEFRRGD